MIWKYLIPLLALIGAALAAAVIVLDNRVTPPPESALAATEAPYASFIAGAGLIEASTGNVAIGTPISGVVAEIAVEAGSHVEAGMVLFKIDNRALQATLPPAIARIAEARANLDKASADLKIAERVKSAGVISAEVMAERRADVAIGEAALATAKAVVEQIRSEIERHVVRAPFSGDVLQIKLHLGEYAEAGATTTPLLILGSKERLHVRVEIDEYDAWRFAAERPATAFVRGNPVLKVPLRFERIEPYIIPKTALTGSNTERTDTRVLQVLYSFEPAAFPLYIGQQLDVYIEAQPVRPVTEGGAS